MLGWFSSIFLYYLSDQWDQNIFISHDGKAKYCNWSGCKRKLLDEEREIV